MSDCCYDNKIFNLKFTCLKKIISINYCKNYDFVPLPFSDHRDPW